MMALVRNMSANDEPRLTSPGATCWNHVRSYRTAIVARSRQFPSRVWHHDDEPWKRVLSDIAGTRSLQWYRNSLHLPAMYVVVWHLRSTLTSVGVNCVATWFNRRRGLAVGVLYTGASIGGVVFPILVSRLLQDVGFGWTMRINAFLILFLLIVANVTVRQRPETAQRQHRDKQVHRHSEFKKPFRQLDFVLVLASFFFYGFGYFIPINYLQVQALKGGMDPDLVQYLLPMLNGASLFGRLLSGFASDRVGRYNIYITACGFSTLWILALWLPATGDAAIISFAVLFGLFAGGYVSLITPIVIQISPMSEIGFRMGAVYFVSAFSGFTTNPIGGAIVEGGGGWAGIKVFAGVFCLVGTAFVLAARIRNAGWRLNVVY